MFLHEISSQPSCKSVKGLFLTSSILVLDKKMITPTISLSSTSLNFQELGTSTVFDGYTDIQNTNDMDVCLSQPFLLVPIPIRKGIIFNKVFVLLIRRRSASSIMPPIGTSGVGLT